MDQGLAFLEGIMEVEFNAPSYSERPAYTVQTLANFAYWRLDGESNFSILWNVVKIYFVHPWAGLPVLGLESRDVRFEL